MFSCPVLGRMRESEPAKRNIRRFCCEANTKNLQVVFCPDNYRTGKDTVCRRVRTSLSPESLHAGAVKGLSMLTYTLTPGICVNTKLTCTDYIMESKQNETNKNKKQI